MSRAERMYGKSPTMKRGEHGHMEVSHNANKPSKADETASGTEGVLSPEMRHTGERGEMHMRHMREHMEMQHKHETEHLLHEHGGHGEKGEMHSRHHQELVAMHERHEGEDDEMAKRHSSESSSGAAGEGEKGGAQLIEKTEQDKKE